MEHIQTINPFALMDRDAMVATSKRVVRAAYEGARVFLKEDYAAKRRATPTTHRKCEPLPAPRPETLERARKTTARTVIEKQIEKLEAARAASELLLVNSSYPEYHEDRIARVDKKLGALREKLEGLK